MKLIITATEINSSLELIRAIAKRLQRSLGKSFIDDESMDNFRDPKIFLQKVIDLPKHGFSVTIPEGKTLEDAQLTELALVIEITEAEYIAINKLMVRHSGMLVSIFKMYFTFIELLGEFASTFAADLSELASTTMKFGSPVHVAQDAVSDRKDENAPLAGNTVAQ